MEHVENSLDNTKDEIMSIFYKMSYGKKNNKKKQFEIKLVTILKDRINKEIKRVIESKEDQAVIGIKAKRDRDIRTIKTKNRDLESEELYYKPVSINKVWNNNHIEHESNGDRNKTYQ